jgi:hypothetical protein
VLYDQYFIDDLKDRADLVRRAVLVFICALLLASTSIGQREPKAVLHDEFSNAFCSETVRYKLDIFLATIWEHRDSVGYLVASADRTMPGRFHKYLRLFQNHVRFREFPAERIRYFRGPNKDSLFVQVWIVPKGAAFPSADLNFGREQFSKPILFDSSEILALPNGEIEIGGNAADEPCDIEFDLNMFAIYLGSDPKLDAYLVASSKGRRERSKAEKALQVTASKLSNEHGVLRSRIKTVFVGIKENSGMQLWLVPQGTKLPEFTSRLP